MAAGMGMDMGITAHIMLLTITAPTTFLTITPMARIGKLWGW